MKRKSHTNRLDFASFSATTLGDVLDTEPLPSVHEESASMRPDVSGGYAEQPLGMGLTAQLTRITPAMASEFLRHIGETQRNIRAGHLDMLTREMVEGRFMLNGEPVILDENMRVIDGRHRLNAILKSGKSQYQVVIRYVRPDAYASIDNGASRSSADALREGGIDNAKTVAAALRLIDQYRKGKIESRSSEKISPLETKALLETYKDIDASLILARRLRAFKCGESVFAACHYIFSHVHDGRDRDKADAFFNSLYALANLPANSVILSLHRRLSDGKMAKDDVIFLCFKAWKYYLANKPCSLLRRHPAEEFPVL